MTQVSRSEPQRRDPIKIIPYDDDWAAAFQQQRPRVESALRPWLVGPVEHIGSTSVPDLAAKPIIDVLARISDYDVGDVIRAMSGIGWTYAPRTGRRPEPEVVVLLLQAGLLPVEDLPGQPP